MLDVRTQGTLFNLTLRQNALFFVFKLGLVILEKFVLVQKHLVAVFVFFDLALVLLGLLSELLECLLHCHDFGVVPVFELAELALLSLYDSTQLLDLPLVRLLQVRQDLGFVLLLEVFHLLLEESVLLARLNNLLL